MNKSTNSKATAEKQPAVPFGFRPGGPMNMFREVEKSKNPRGTLARLGGYLKPQRWLLAGTAVLVVITSLVDLAGPYLMGLAIDSYINKSDLAGLGRLLELMIGTYVIAAAGTWLQAYLMAGVAQRAVRDMRRDLFARLQTLPLRFFDQRSHGELMSRLTNDVDNVSNVLASSFSQLISSLFGLVVAPIGARVIWELAASAIDRTLSSVESSRLKTLLPLAHKILAVVLIALVGLIALSQLGVDIAPLLAGAGVVRARFAVRYGGV